jgi:pimeloyl-ACP methyl ester carboxylesterase
MSTGEVVFSHGQESGPWGTKIRAMAETAREAGWAVTSIDYQGIAEPLKRVEKLLAYTAGLSDPPLLVGSSMGGYVSLAAAAHTPVRGLFLLAPALYLPGYEEHLPEPAPTACATTIVHGWRDDVVPFSGSLRWGERTHARVLLVDGDHRLTDNIEFICAALAICLAESRAENPSG